MTLFKRGNIWWAYVWVDGVRHHKSTGTSNRRQAETIERQFHDELNVARQRMPKLSPDMTFAELAARFIGEEMATPYSLDRLKHLLPFFSDMPLVGINTSAIRTYRKERQQPTAVIQKGKQIVKTIKAATVNRDLSVLRRILYWGVEEGYLTANPLGRLRLERERRTKRPVMSVGEEIKLLAASPIHLQRLILCALHTGMRRGELLHQRFEDIDFDNRILYVSYSKTPEGEMREIPLTSRLYAMLVAIRKEHTSNAGPVFTFDGNPLKNVKTTWASSLRRSGIRHFRFHDLRHTANTRMMLAGVLQEVRREIIGHTSQRSRDVNDRYTQIELPEKREAILKLETWLERQLDSQMQSLSTEEAKSQPPQPSTATPTKEQPHAGNQSPAA
jgi:integrase